MPTFAYSTGRAVKISDGTPSLRPRITEKSDDASISKSILAGYRDLETRGSRHRASPAAARRIRAALQTA
jgi:hypothetical protein